MPPRIRWQPSPPSVTSPVPISGFTNVAQVEASHGLFVPAFVVRRTTGAMAWWSGGGAIEGPVPSISDATDVTVGVSYTAGSPYYCAVRSGGAVTCWGGSAWGVMFSTSGTEIMTGISDVEAVPSTNFGGESGVCGVTTTGSVSCIGSDGFGQLGLGGAYDLRYTVAAVSPYLAGVISLSSFDKGACALDALGVIRCWGVTDAFQTGTGTVGPDPGQTQRTPVVVVGF